MTKNRPYFLWDYDLSEADVHNILHDGSSGDKNWLLSRIFRKCKIRRRLEIHFFGRSQTNDANIKDQKTY